MAYEVESGSHDSALVAERRPVMPKEIVSLLKDSGSIFMANRAASRGAAIAFCSVTSIAPVLLM